MWRTPALPTFDATDRCPGEMTMTTTTIRSTPLRSALRLRTLGTTSGAARARQVGPAGVGRLRVRRPVPGRPRAHGRRADRDRPQHQPAAGGPGVVTS